MKVYVTNHEDVAGFMFSDKFGNTRGFRFVEGKERHVFKFGCETVIPMAYNFTATQIREILFKIRMSAKSTIEYLNECENVELVILNNAVILTDIKKNNLVLDTRLYGFFIGEEEREMMKDKLSEPYEMQLIEGCIANSFMEVFKSCKGEYIFKNIIPSKEFIECIKIDKTELTVSSIISRAG